LALCQAAWVGERLKDLFPGLEVEYITIKTKGDKILDVPLATVGGKGLFVKEIEEALLAGRIDCAVHSVKDIPTETHEALEIAAYPEREDPRDVLVARRVSCFQDLPPGARIGTSSLRRRAQVLHLRPDLQVIPIRGNLDTRLKKLEKEALDGILLAAAGIRRMGLTSTITEILPPDRFIPAVGQGALGVEVRKDDPKVQEMIRRLDHPETRICVEAERAFLRRLAGGCQVPLGAYARLDGRTLILVGMVSDVGGRPLWSDRIHGPIHSPETLGRELAERILEAGALSILQRLLGGGLQGEPP
jgi:hydroxymethylbilane synthase